MRDELVENRYRLVRKIGEGAMGEVYLAEHVTLGRQEAIKVLHARMATDPAFVARFRREARAANRVQHPNIVVVYDFGRLPDGRFFLAMEYAEGERLDVLLRRDGPFPVDRAVGILRQLAAAVDFAHSRGVVHRDLKPGNIVLSQHRGQKDFVKILDFGLAKIVLPGYRDTVAPTRHGEILGTPSYMAPEQFLGIGNEPRSDLYALGCIAYEILTGAPPFLGSFVQLADAHRHAVPPPPSSRRPGAGIPPELDEVVLRCLAKSAEARFSTGHELLIALESVPTEGLARSTLRGLAPWRPEDLPRTQEMTAVGLEALLPDLPVLGSRRTAPMPLEEARHAYRQALRAAAETMRDLGVDDSQLIVALTDILERESQIAQLTAELQEVEIRMNHLEQAAREREATLRFALAELGFERGQKGARGTLDGQMAILEGRLKQAFQEFHDELDVLTDQSVELTASRHGLEELLDVLYAGLEGALEPHLCAWEGDAQAALAVQRVRNAKELLRVAEISRPIQEA